MAQNTAGRNALPKNQETPFENETPGVTAPDLLQPLPAPQMGAYRPGASNGAKVFPMPYSSGGYFTRHGCNWDCRWVEEALIEQLLCNSRVSVGYNLNLNGVLGRGIRSIPCVPPSHPKHDFARELATFRDDSRRQMRGSWYAQVRQFSGSALKHGHCIGPINMRVQETGQYAGKWMLDELPVWPNFGYQFMQDGDGRFVAIQVRYADGRVLDIDKRKFVHFCFRPERNHPGGTSLFSAVCEDFYLQVQERPELMALLTQYGRPSLYVIAPKVEAGVPVTNIPVYNLDGTRAKNPDNTDMELSPLQYNSLVTAEYKAGTVVNLSGGSLVGLLQATPGGEAVFRFFEEIIGKNIAKVLLGTSQLTESAGVVSSGNADASESVMMQYLIDEVRMIEEVDENQIGALEIELNYGKAALDYLPISDLGSKSNPRLTAQMNAISGQISSGAYDEDQWFWFCAFNGQPLPNPKAKKLVEPATAASSGGNQGNKA